MTLQLTSYILPLFKYNKPYFNGQNKIKNYRARTNFWFGQLKNWQWFYSSWTVWSLLRGCEIVMLVQFNYFRRNATPSPFKMNTCTPYVLRNNSYYATGRTFLNCCTIRWCTTGSQHSTFSDDWWISMYHKKFGISIRNDIYDCRMRWHMNIDWWYK